MRTRTLVCAIAALAASASTAHAQPVPEDGFSLKLGAGAAVANTYQGSKATKVRPLPYVDLNWADTVFVGGQDLLRVDALRAASVETPGIAFGPVTRFRFGRKESDDRIALRGLGDIPTVFETGLFASVELGGGFSARLSGTQALNGDAGFAAEASLNYATSVGPVFLVGGVSAQAVDAQYNRTYFGVSQARATAARRQAYAPGGGLQRAGLDLVASVPITDRLSIVGVGAYQRLLGDAADSPIVRGSRGSADQIFGGVFLTWSFF